MKHSDFIVYVDESGDHSLESINPRYPLFVLAMCVLHKRTYTHEVAPALRHLKFRTFGHDMVVLHESDIRKRTGAFAGLTREACSGFLDALTHIIDQSEFKIVAVVIDKRWLRDRVQPGVHAYHSALDAALRLLFTALRLEDQDNRLVHVICEARGAKEDAQLKLEFTRMCEAEGYAQRGIHFELIVADKRTNSEGLQLADLTARPIGLSILRPDQPNRAVEIIKRKLQLSIRIDASIEADTDA